MGSINSNWWLVLRLLLPDCLQTSCNVRSDDLELMEREVYEELKTKKEVEKFMAKSTKEDLAKIRDRSQ